MKPDNKRERAAVLVFAVLLLAAGVFVLAGIAQLAATQSLVGQREWEMLNRRVTLENSRAMARQFMLARMFSNVVSTSAFGYTTNWGGFSISNTFGPTAGLYWDAASTNAGQIVDPFNPMERGGFYPGVARAELIAEVTETDTNSVEWDFVVRTRSPITAGYNYVQQYPGTNSSLADAVNIIAVVGEGDDRKLYFKGSSNTRNIPDVPVSSTTNTNMNDANGYQGSFAVPISAVEPQQFTGGISEQVVGDPANPTGLRVEVDLEVDGFTPSALGDGISLRYALPNTTTTNVTELEIKGSSDGRDQPPLQIVVTNHPYLTNIILSGSNLADEGRRVYLHLRAPSNAVVFTTSAASAQWRLGISAIDSGNLDFTGLTNVTLIGGLRINSDGPPLGVQSESDPQGLDFIADQMMWLEDYRVP